MMSDQEVDVQEKALRAEIERVLPDFANSCRDDTDVVIIHQDSFAADYQLDKYVLLGMAIKFAGLYAKEVHITGRNRETLKGSRKS